MNPFRTPPLRPSPAPRPYLFRRQLHAPLTELVIGLVCFAAVVVLTR